MPCFEHNSSLHAAVPVVPGLGLRSSHFSKACLPLHPGEGEVVTWLCGVHKLLSLVLFQAMPLLFCFWFSKRSLQLLGRPRFCSVNQLASHSLPLYRHVGVCFLSISYHLSMCYSLPLSLSLSLSLWVSLFYVFILTFVGLRGGGMKINMDVQSDVFILKWSFSAVLPLLCNASDFPC